MEKDRLFEDILTFQDSNDKDELMMIISNNMDIIYDGEGAVSAKKWESLTEDILRWHANKKAGM